MYRHLFQSFFSLLLGVYPELELLLGVYPELELLLGVYPELELLDHMVLVSTCEFNFLRNHHTILINLFIFVFNVLSPDFFVLLYLGPYFTCAKCSTNIIFLFGYFLFFSLFFIEV